MLYAQSLHLVEKIYLTKVYCEVEGDAYYPEIPDQFEKVAEEKVDADLPFSFQDFRRKTLN